MTGSAARAGLPGSARLATLRRLYLYLVAFVCLLTLRINAESVAADLGSVWASWTDPRLVAPPLAASQDIVRNGSFMLAGLVFFAVHWGVIARSAQRTAEELASPVRRAFWLLTTLTFLYWVCADAAGLLAPAFHVALGQPLPAAWLAWPAYGALALPLALSLPVLAYGGGRLYQEKAWAAQTRFGPALEGAGFALFSLVALFTLLGAARAVLFHASTALAFRLAPLAWTPSFVDNAAEALAAVWTMLLVLNQVWRHRANLAAGRAHRGRDALHIGFLQAGRLLGAASFLYGAILLVQWLLGLFHASELTVAQRLPAVAVYLISVVPVSLACWLWFRRAATRSAAATRIGPWRAFLEQAYAYALTGIVLFWAVAGSSEALGYAIEAWVWPFRAEADATSAWATADLLWASLAQALVGAPAWFLCWRRQRGEPPEGWPAWPRRIYLYGTAFVATVALLFASAGVLSSWLNWLVDRETLVALALAIDTELSAFIVLSAALAFHVRWLRRPRAAARAAPAGVEDNQDEEQTQGQARAAPAGPEARKAAVRRALAELYAAQQATQQRIAALEKELAELTASGPDAEEHQTP